MLNVIAEEQVALSVLYLNDDNKGITVTGNNVVELFMELPFNSSGMRLIVSQGSFSWLNYMYALKF